MCESCPVRGLAAIRPCPGTGHGRFCDDVRRGLPGRAAQLIAVATGGEPPRSAEETARLRAAMDAEICRHGSGPCGCGAEPRICSHPGRPDAVKRDYCLLCVLRPDWHGRPEG